MIRRTLALAVVAALGVLALTPAHAASVQKVEVVEVRGPIDNPIADTIVGAIAAAESDRLEAIVLQIDSRGAICGSACLDRIVARIESATVPVVTWVGPPGASAQDAAELLAFAGHVRAIAPGAVLGPAVSLDLRRMHAPPRAGFGGADPRKIYSADEALDTKRVDVQALQLPDLLRRIDGLQVRLASGARTLRTDPENLSVRFRKPGVRARLAHAVSLPSYSYLLLLVALALLAFELFHPGTKFPPKPGFAHKFRMVFGKVFISMWIVGVIAGGYSIYGLMSTAASWPAVAMIVGGIVLLCVDLRYEGFGLFTGLGTAGLIAGSLLLYRGPFLRLHPAIIVIGILSIWLFFVSGMTRVVRDLRAVARGERQIVEAHPGGGVEADAAPASVEPVSVETAEPAPPTEA